MRSELCDSMCCRLKDTESCADCEDITKTMTRDKHARVAWHHLRLTRTNLALGVLRTKFRYHADRVHARVLRKGVGDHLQRCHARTNDNGETGQHAS